MRHIPRTSPHRTGTWRIAAVLLLGSGIAVLLPTGITRRVSDALQVLVPFQDGVNRVAELAAPPPTDTRQIDGLRFMADSFAAQNRKLRDDVEQLTRVRGRGLGRRGRLIPARVVADDAASWRRSKLILGGTRSGVTRQSGVLTSTFSVDLGSEGGVPTGSAVLAAEVLIGVVEHAGTYTSRVRLLSDPQTRMPVAIGRVQDGAFSGPDAAFWLMGTGRGGIEIRDVHHRYVTEGSIRVGDTVLTRTDEVTLPPSITIGVIGEILTDPGNGLLFVLEVTSPVDVEDVRNVYVADLTEAPR